MKILILGGKGMAGHVMAAYFQKSPAYHVLYTSRDKKDKNSIYLDVTNPNSVEKVLDSIKPDIVINCIGILNEHAEKDPLLALQVNSFLPHQLAKLVDRYHGKLIHISTDCVFSGEEGDYSENAIPNGTTEYARSKQLGDITDDKNLTIRTSIIGPELKDDGIGLFLWFMKQTGEIKGYKNVLWNGVTTLELAKAAEKMIRNQVTGIYHLGGNQKISKYDLLKLIQDVFEKEDVTIIPDYEMVQDRTIKNTRMDFDYQIPSYREMLLSLKDWMKGQ
ncbi:dTDP-4-dehydrorhamnose reductase family protein [Niallia sp. 03133]|uniref:dTDP-4-dehydrorhamnose reductase family protein n=1 Tax=Niallia sp. 03133 TaxID=3458060 RepID=UPI00404514D9